MEITMIAVFVVLGFALVMWAITTIYKKARGNKPAVEKPAKATVSNKDKKESPFEKYCDDKENDNYQIRAKWILLHDKNERDDRGQDDSM